MSEPTPPTTPPLTMSEPTLLTTPPGQEIECAENDLLPFGTCKIYIGSSIQSSIMQKRIPMCPGVLSYDLLGWKVERLSIRRALGACFVAATSLRRTEWNFRCAGHVNESCP
ncbi:hypothetical protein RRG08_017309 [Elysia crispata]|uniref:Uncharacterized protein n=1 Tax=Elysia crispata TaxID=231223 RepID=A0AAE1D3G8_9GAST|nr:hypothetical protein RRG08_017309 [Elysia crispata]